MDIKLFDSKLR